MTNMRYLIETNLFGVCSKIGERLNICSSSIRVYFIYASFLTFGSPIIVYLILAFWMDIKKHIRRHESPSIWEF